MTHKIRLKGTEMELTVRDRAYPYFKNKILYLRMVLLGTDGTPIKFISVMPQDILYRLQPYTDEMMEYIETADNEFAEEEDDDILTAGGYHD